MHSFEVGHDSAVKWGAIPVKGATESGCPVAGDQIISGGDGSAGTISAIAVPLPVCNQRFSISSILRRTCSQKLAGIWGWATAFY